MFSTIYEMLGIHKQWFVGPNNYYTSELAHLTTRNGTYRRGIYVQLALITGAQKNGLQTCGDP